MGKENGQQKGLIWVIYHGHAKSESSSYYGNGDSAYMISPVNFDTIDMFDDFENWQAWNTVITHKYYTQPNK